jgi:hypothetical protein
MAAPRSQSDKLLPSKDLGANWRRIRATKSRCRKCSNRVRQASSSSHIQRQIRQDVSQLPSLLVNRCNLDQLERWSLGGGLRRERKLSHVADQLKRHHTSMPLPGQLLSHHYCRSLCLRVKHGFNEIKHHLRHEAVTALPSPMRPLGHSDWRT